LERKKGEEFLQLRAALVQFLSLSGFRSRGYNFLEEALEASEQNQGSISPKIQTKTYNDRSEGGIVTALFGESIKLYRKIAENIDTECSMKKEETFLDARGERRTAFPLRAKEPLLLPAFAELTAREIEVLRLLAMGLSNKQIAERLVLSRHTVNVHIHSIFSKLAVHSRSAATRYALDHQLA
jgi:ATP/maltotriose-dependent transcriptional regulator MalT